MYAVIAHGGKQYRVSPGEVVRVERVAGKPGDAVEFASVLLVGGGQDGARFGKAAAAARVMGTVVGDAAGDKVLIFKKKRCKQYRRTRGHRQHLTDVRIERID